MPLPARLRGFAASAGLARRRLLRLSREAAKEGRISSSPASLVRSTVRRMRLPLLIALVAAVLPSPAEAQQPGFPGTWAATKEAPKDLPPAPSPPLGQRFALAVEGDTVTLTRTGRTGSLVLPMPLGSEVRWRPPAQPCQADFVRIEKMAMEGDALVFTLVGILPPGGSEPRVNNIRYVIRAEGPDAISVQSTIAQQGQPKPVATIYRKSAEPMPPATDPEPLPIKGVPAKATDAGWIAAMWVATSANNVTTEERWTPPATGVMLGVGRTLRGADMPAFEFLCIAEREGSLVYFAMPNARTPATPFVLTAITPDSMTFENPSHDFPKLIRYTRLPDGSLQTTISGGPGTRERHVTLKKQ